MASAMTRTARSTASTVAGEVDWIPPTFRTYCLAAASTSSGVAAGSSPLRIVMFRHMPSTLGPPAPVCAVPGAAQAPPEAFVVVNTSCPKVALTVAAWPSFARPNSPSIVPSVEKWL